MTTYWKQRHEKPVRVEPDSVTAQRIEEMQQERCDRCLNLYPASMMTIEDGLHVCPNDVDTTTAEWKARQIEADAAFIATHQERPQLYAPSRESFVAVTGFADAEGTPVAYSSPLRVVAGGAAVDLVVSGVDLSATDTVSVAAGLNVSATVDSSTQVTLSVSADAGLGAGDYALVYNDSTYRGLIRVR